MERKRGTRSAFTLVELLVVIAIIGVLVALLLPAVQAARESGRRAACMNNLKQLGLATLQHVDRFKHFPTGGWGEKWVGNPDAGFDERQWGGWVYNILPFLEQEALRDLGNGVVQNGNTVNNPADSSIRLGKTLGIMHCPSRRGGQTYPVWLNPILPPNSPWSLPITRQPIETSVTSQVARGDFAMNSGVRGGSSSSAGNLSGCSLSAPDSGNADYPRSWSNYKSGQPPWAWPSDTFTGISFVRSKVTDGQVKDGMTYTYMVGEKFVDAHHYDTGKWDADNDSVFSGFGNDNYRLTAQAPLNDASASEGDHRCRFGSPHAGITQFAFCDGAVRSISNAIDPTLHRFMGERADRQILDESKIW